MTLYEGNYLLYLDGLTHMNNRNEFFLLMLYSIIKHVSVSKPQCIQSHEVSHDSLVSFSVGTVEIIEIF